MTKIPIEINLEFTPNPDTLKYSLNRRILVTGTENYTSKAEADEFSPLAKKLFELDEICGTMIGADFITVTTKTQENLRELNRAILSTIKAHLESDEIICIPRAKEEPRGDETTDARRIREIIDEEIRPMVAMDGGDITFERYENGTVYLEMIGACSGCPSSTMTLKMGIQNRLQQEFPDIKDVVPI